MSPGQIGGRGECRVSCGTRYAPNQAGAALGASRGRGQAPPLQRRVSCGTRYAPNQVGAALVAACGRGQAPPLQRRVSRGTRYTPTR